MNKEKKNIIAIVAVLLISIIVFTGCAGNDSKDADKSSEKASVSQSKEEASVSGETSKEATVAEEDVKSDKAETKPDDEKSEKKQPGEKKADASKEENKSETTTPPEDTKYGDAEIYETKEGVPAAKTESGTEVELTGENLQNLFAEYEKEKGSGSEREKELLDQLQLILETQGAVQ